jgi:hypothetical protein
VAGGTSKRSFHDEEYLGVFHADAEGWAERERERDLIAVLVESAHLRSAARAWYRRRSALLDDPAAPKSS